jgi:glutamyl-tRNA reductase
MKGVNYVTNDKGEKLAMIIDINNPKNITTEYLEELEDIIAIELLKNEPSEDWESVKNELRKAGKTE